MTSPACIAEPDRFRVDDVVLEGELAVPVGARGVVIFAQGRGDAASRNRLVARQLLATGIGTFLFDLITRGEAAEPVFRTPCNVGLLTRRLLAATAWVVTRPAARDLAVGYFGASTAAAAALCASTQRPGVRALVCGGGRPDLAEHTLAHVAAPTLLIVGGWDDTVLQLNREALPRLPGEKHLEIVPCATHHFEEPGALEKVALLATRWFARHFHGTRTVRPS